MFHDGFHDAHFCSAGDFLHQRGAASQTSTNSFWPAGTKAGKRASRLGRRDDEARDHGEQQREAHTRARGCKVATRSESNRAGGSPTPLPLSRDPVDRRQRGRTRADASR
ncbi:hypothetical protein VFPFJ_06549 [Purpureocillium lilacinum]|uniref:Uncharacterized protein n=1 Tax=Purpureocillium lilacinum TaxID=33203 RepID=A0A179HI75_PURLI|nr:hypothetical protein VFPFJ_06549 [Purpureocillium lilacinum]OAQ90136.1 hypothetical protein VFPFJ_06549 [Purpureocillium lilacinum]